MEYLEDSEPSEGDYTLADSGPLGSRTSVAEHGIKFLQEFASDADALLWIRNRMESEQFFPNVWRVSDHGNWSLITDY